MKIDSLHVSAYTVPTDFPESDGTAKWDKTTMVLVELKAGNKTGLGYTYANPATAFFINHTLKEIVEGKDVFNNTSITEELIRSIRNNGSCGISMMALSAIDNALWDLKARLLEIPLCKLIGQVKDKMLLYGSGGFTSYSDSQTKAQFENWSSKGIRHFKMKIGRDPDKDLNRVKNARAAIGDDAFLFVDANGAYNVKQALEKARQFADLGVIWFEEPVSSDNLKGLHFIREHAPEKMNITAGEYGYNLPYFETMLQAGAVDILQADATRCGGTTGFLKAGTLCEANQVPFSSHCAPAQHLHAAICTSAFYIAEYFHDHQRIENMFFEGVGQPVDGFLKPDLSRPGNGLEFKHKEAKIFKL